MTDRKPTVDVVRKNRAFAAFITVTLIAALYAAVQHTAYAPFPHRADDFMTGFCLGAALVTVVFRLASRPPDDRTRTLKA